MAPTRANFAVGVSIMKDFATQQLQPKPLVVRGGAARTRVLAQALGAQVGVQVAI